jgi:hypothetical protein
MRRHDKRQEQIMRKIMNSFFAASLAAAGTLAANPAHAHFVPAPCDFITGGGWVLNDTGDQDNFGSHGGCKNGAFWGHVNVLDHSYTPTAHLKSTSITGYLMDPEFPNARDICGFADVRVNGTTTNMRFRVRMEDNGEPGANDRFGVRLMNGYHVSTRQIGPADKNGGGNIQLHKPNPSTTGPVPAPTEAEMCGGLMTP